MNSVRAIGDKIIYIHNGLKEWEGSSALLSSPDVPEGVLSSSTQAAYSLPTPLLTSICLSSRKIRS